MPAMPIIMQPITVRPLIPGQTYGPDNGRGLISSPTKGIDTYAENDEPASLLYRNLDVVSAETRQNYGAQFSGSIVRLWVNSCAFVSWDVGVACEKVGSATGLNTAAFENCHFTGCGTVGLILGDAESVVIRGCVFDLCGWNPQGDRQDPTQTHALYINPDNCNHISIKKCLFNDARMNATRCCGSVCAQSVFINNGCGILGGKITKSISGNVVTRTHDPAEGLPAGGMGINADSPDGMVVSGNLVADSGSDATGNLYAMGVHGTYANVAFTGNTVADWAVNGQGVGIGFGTGLGPNCLCQANIVQMRTGGKCVEVAGGNLANIAFGGNIFWSTDEKPFRYAGQDYTWDEWKQMTGDTTSRFIPVEFADGSRDVSRFVVEVLGLQVDDAGAQIAQAVRSYPSILGVFSRWMRDGFKPKDQEAIQ